jgi:hypothetical protein
MTETQRWENETHSSPAASLEGQAAAPSAADEIWGHLERVEAAATYVANRFDKSDWIELVAAVLIAVATIATAWSAYQSRRWCGSQALETAAAARARFESTNASRDYMTQHLTDVSTWENYVSAREAGNYTLADFWVQHARPEFKPALEAWIASASAATFSASTQTGSSVTPFDQPSFHYAAEASAFDLGAEADQHAGNAAQDNQRSDNYVLLTVMFALVLFFAGVGAKFRGKRTRCAMVSLATLLFVVGLTFLVSMPQNVGL